MAFKNRFGWSLSRERMFDECRRRYFFHYYLSWGGWQRSASIVSREAFKLKRLVPLALWRGQLVHYVVSKILQSMKVRGRDYLRIIYGPDYDLPEHLERLRERGLQAKRSLAFREFVLGLEGLDRFVAREPLRRVHECVFGVLALESEPIDPRL